MNFGNAVRIGGGFGLGEKIGAFFVLAQDPFEQGVVAAGGFLGDVADGCVAQGGDGAVVGGDFARDQAQERGFAGAIAADKSDLVAGRDGRSGGVKDQSPFDAVCQFVDVQHGAHP